MFNKSLFHRGEHWLRNLSHLRHFGCRAPPSRGTSSWLSVPSTAEGTSTYRLVTSSITSNLFLRQRLAPVYWKPSICFVVPCHCAHHAHASPHLHVRAQRKTMKLFPGSNVGFVRTSCSADRLFRTWRNVVLNSFACNCEGHLVTLKRRDESDMTAVELAALHHEPAVDPLRWFSGFVAGKQWHSSDAVFQRLRELIHISCTAGTMRPTELGSSGSDGGAWRDRHRTMWMPTTTQTMRGGLIHVPTPVLGGLEMPRFRLCDGSCSTHQGGRPSPYTDASVNARGGNLGVNSISSSPLRDFRLQSTKWTRVRRGRPSETARESRVALLEVVRWLLMIFLWDELCSSLRELLDHRMLRKLFTLCH